jgi:hypothetical protein
MSCTRELTWFNFFSKLSFLFLPAILFIGSAKGQGSPTEGTWQLKLEVDNYFSVRNAWATEEKSASIVVYDTNGHKHYALSLITMADEWNHFNFPEDFVALSDIAKINSLTPQYLIFEVRYKRSAEATSRFYFDPSPNALLQLDFYSFKEKLDTTVVWGRFIDAYRWEDKLGENVIVRSELETKYLGEDSNYIFKKYLYLYHFRQAEEELELIRKFTDVYGGCNARPAAGFSLPSIELTDIDRDTVGEISTIYDLYCSGSDTTTYHSKLLLTSDGKKFMLDATINPCEMGEERFEDYSKSSSFKFYPFLLRFMQEKIHNYHQ